MLCAHTRNSSHAPSTTPNPEPLSLSLVTPLLQEVHYNQHGLLMLQGQGIYRLGDKWYPVQAGDAIWMPPFVPQWYAALGPTPTRYLIYKDTNVDPLFSV